MIEDEPMKKRANAVSVIEGTDGPTSVFVIKKNQKLTWKQKWQRFCHKMKRAYVERTLKIEGHTLDEVMEYIVNVHGFIEVSKDEAKEEYNQMRAAFLMQYAPELLGEYAKMPRLKSESKEDIMAHIEQSKERQQRALLIPVTEFDIDFYKYKKSFEDINDDMHIIIEKKYAYIGGGASGNKKLMKRFQSIYKDVYRYYGVTKEDVENQTKRYKDVVRTLSM